MAQKILNNIVGGSRKSAIHAICTAYTENMYAESQDADQASTAKALLSIYGNSTVMTFPESNCRGIYRASRGHDGLPLLFAAYGSHLYVCHEGQEPHAIFQLSNSVNDPVTMCETGGTDPYLVVCDGVSIFAVCTTLQDADMEAKYQALKLPKRVDKQTPIVPTHICYLYGYLLCNDSGNDAFYTSYQYPFETTNAYGEVDWDVFMVESADYKDTGFITYAEWMPDAITAMISNGSYMYALGTRSYQIFEYNDDLNYPFTSPNTAAAAVGIKAPHSLCGIGQHIFWLGSSDIGNNGIFSLNGANLQRISNPDIEREISLMEYPEDCVGQCWQENQHIFIAFTFLTDKKTFVYDMAEQSWHNRSSYGYGFWRPHFATFAFDNDIVFGIRDDNVMVKADPNKYTEYDDKPIVRRRRGGVCYSDHSPFYINALNVFINNGEISDPNLTPQVMMRFTTNGSDWSDMDIGLLGNIGNYNLCTTWWNLGWSPKSFTVELACSENCNFAIMGAKIDATPCNMFVGG